MEPLKKRSKPHRKQDKEAGKGVAAKPKEVKDLDKEEESTTKDVQHIMTQVLRVCKERGRVGYFTFLLDPNSFAKTVENMFHFAFLVKDGRVGVTLGRDGMPYIFLRKDCLIRCTHLAFFPCETPSLDVGITKHMPAN